MRPRCSQGCERYALARGRCKGCYEKHRYETDPVYRAKRKARTAARKARQTPDVRAVEQVRINAYNRERRTDPAYREQERQTSLRYVRGKAGFTPELVAALRIAQRRTCAICPRWFGRERLHREHADHCHSTNKPRGLLCAACNLALGYYETAQRPAGLRIACYETYLAEPPTVQHALI